jgi:hypothetical protein
MKVGPWQVVDGFCTARVIEGGDPDKIADRVAFIEKTPRIRIREAVQFGSDYPDFLNWAEGPRGLGPDDPEPQQWCDDMLKLLGYEV